MFKASFAAISAWEFPSIPMWPGIQCTLTLPETVCGRRERSGHAEAREANAINVS